MPRLGYDMTAGTIVRWLKHVPDTVATGEPIAEIETDKAIVEIEASSDGTLLMVVAAEGDSVQVGQPIAFVGEVGEEIEVQVPTLKEPPASTRLPNIPAGKNASLEARHSRVAASPLARRLAKEKGVDLTRIEGTGPGGRITNEDVLTVVSAQAASTVVPASTGHRIPLGRMAQAVARRTAEAARQVPHFYLTTRIDMTDALELRRSMNEALEGSERVSVNDLVVKACALALRKLPVFNSTFEQDHLAVAPHVNIGIAVALPDGLVVPAITNCESRSLKQIAVASKDLATRARSGKLRQDEYSGTFIVSNLGMYDVDSFTAIIAPPQVAALAVGSVTPQPVATKGEIVVRQMMSATLSTDHRVAGGAEAAQFAAEVKRLLQEPQVLGKEG